MTRPQLATAVALTVLLIVSVFGSLHIHHNGLGDPDRYYHLAISRLMVESGGLVDALPQLPDIGWSKAFPEKEFLFHVLTAGSFAAYGELGVDVLMAVLAFAGFVLLWCLCRLFVSPWVATSVVVTTVATHYYFFSRIFVIRPHVLSVALFLAVMLAALRLRPRWTALVCALFALSYHSVFIPMIALAAIVAPQALEHWRTPAIVGKSVELRVALFGLAGLIVGVLVNPYFPYNLETLLLIVDISLGRVARVAQSSFGLEMLPMRTDAYLKSNLVVVVAAASALLALPTFVRRRALSDSSLAVCLTLLVFLVLSLLNRRALEYALPMSAVAFCAVIALRPRLGAAAVTVAVLGAVASNPTGALQLLKEEPRFDHPHLDALDAALSAIPKDRGTAKILNTNWSDGAIILHRRPNLRLVAVLDPSFLARAQPGLHAALTQLTDGAVGDVYSLVRISFEADYVLGDADVASTLEREPGFRRIYPATLAGEAPLKFLYAVEPERPAALVRTSDVSFERPGGPSDKSPWPVDGGDEAKAGMTYADLVKLGHAQGLGDDLRCARIDVPHAEVARLAGATRAVVGGGPTVQLWMNGKALFTNTIRAAKPASFAWQVPLPRALVAGDELTAVVCRETASEFLGWALSLWTDAELKTVCASRTPEGSGSDPFAWTSSPTLKCVGEGTYATDRVGEPSPSSGDR